jgi:exodeoxyribonuclease VII large subunit
MDTDRKIFTVTEITRLIKSTLEREFGRVWIQGEISNLRRPSSGHCYFTIKDESAQISAVLFRGDQRRLTFQPRDGVFVRVLGEVTVYERGGNYQIIVRSMEEGGKGALQARFEALKEKLHREGLFEGARKKAIPMLPRHVGVVTSRTGAAIRDILNVVSRRFPNLHILIAPVKVQGEGAAVEIAAAVDALNRRGGLDVMIVARGGGSLEDLWCFNEEVVARAIARSDIPVISAVGHEIDFTISDLAADLRAPTPSAAAELVVGRKDDFLAKIDDMEDRIARSLREALLRARNRLLAAGESYVFREPRNLVRQYLQRLDGLELRLAHEVRGRLRLGRGGLAELSLRMRHRSEMRYRAGVERLRTAASQLKALDPLAVLRRGYSVTTDEGGRVVRSASQVSPGDLITTRVERGALASRVTTTDGEGSG